MRKLLRRFSERLYKWCHPDEYKTTPSTIDQLCTANRKCYDAQEEMNKCKNNSSLNSKFVQSAQNAQHYNKVRTDLMKALDDCLGFPSFITKKTYE